MSRESDELVRQVVSRISDRARGVGRSVSRLGSGRQTEIALNNVNMLPVQTVSDGSDASNPPVSAAPTMLGGATLFVPGYSAAAGSSAATADATGRAGDTLVSVFARSSGGARGAAAPTIDFPGSAASSAGATGTAVATIV